MPGSVTDLTAARGRATAALNWTAPERSNSSTRCFSGRTASSSSAPRPAAKVTSSITSRGARSGQYLARFDRAFDRHRPTGPARLLQRLVRSGRRDGTGRTGRRCCSTSSRSGAATISGGTCPRSSAADNDDLERARAHRLSRDDLGPAARNVHDGVGRVGPPPRKALVRNQAHGSPANLLDLYAASDIPETEGDGNPAIQMGDVRGARRRPAPRLRRGRDVARRTLPLDARRRPRGGRSLLRRRRQPHRLSRHGLLAGRANRGQDGSSMQRWSSTAAMPGGTISRALNEYVARTQSFLQSRQAGSRRAAVLPVPRRAGASRGNALLTHFGGANRPTAGAGFEAAAATLQRRGFTYDYISDRQLLETSASTRAAWSRTAAVPTASWCCRRAGSSRSRRSSTSWRWLEAGAAIVIVGGGPADVAGLGSLEARARAIRRAIASLTIAASASRRMPGRQRPRSRAGARGHRAGAAGGSGADVRAPHRFTGPLLLRQQPQRPRRRWMGAAQTTRRSRGDVFDPMTGRRGAPRASGTPSPAALEVYLQIPAGASLIVAAASQPAREQHHFYTSGRSAGCRWERTGRCASSREARCFRPRGPSTARFMDGVRGRRAASKSFSGTACYSPTFTAPPAGRADAWRLDLGRVYESASVRLNGRDLGTLIGPAFSGRAGEGSIKAGNLLEVFVTNLSANRIADLDRAGVTWKKFYNVNMPARLPREPRRRRAVHGGEMGASRIQVSSAR